ncbi:protein NBR1 homolog isoform X2 [Carya illinoinensis]|nr:protein NBR1 homolog isoform X2 [Carya illinoinensis]XP_042947817.1 protein NBR1 homolog isoform X2 [Carya illinoinensis]
MDDLRKEIRDLFNFPADADFILTYVDEDGDVITLFDNKDLSDALTQRMKVLKINVQLSNNKGFSSYAQSGGSISTQLLTSLQTQHPCPKIIKTGVVTQVSKSVLQQLREALLLHEALSKISEDIVSKAVSDPVLVELVDFISKMAQSHLNLDSQAHSGTNSTTQHVDGEEEEND